MIKEIDGNLISLGKQGEFDVIAHGCNSNSAWNTGIAKQMKMEIPEAFAVDTKTIQGDRSKLGTISQTQLSTPIVANLYTQFEYGDSKVKDVYVEYDALENALIVLKNQFKGQRIGIPKIGAGRAKGDWSQIKPIIEKVFCDPDDDLTIVSLPVIAHVRTPFFKPATSQLNNVTHKNKRQRYTINYQTMNTNLHPRGKRICKICHNKKSVKEMISEIPGVWTCMDTCHEKFYIMVENNHHGQKLFNANQKSNVVLS